MGSDAVIGEVPDENLHTTRALLSSDERMRVIQDQLRGYSTRKEWDKGEDYIRRRLQEWHTDPRWHVATAMFYEDKGNLRQALISYNIALFSYGEKARSSPGAQFALVRAGAVKAKIFWRIFFTGQELPNAETTVSWWIALAVVCMAIATVWGSFQGLQFTIRRQASK